MLDIFIHHSSVSIAGLLSVLYSFWPPLIRLASANDLACLMKLALRGWSVFSDKQERDMPRRHSFTALMFSSKKGVKSFQHKLDRGSHQKLELSLKVSLAPYLRRAKCCKCRHIKRFYKKATPESELLLVVWEQHLQDVLTDWILKRSLRVQLEDV